MWPGTQETPASTAKRLDAILSPIASIASGLGPMNTIPAAAQALAKSARSDRNPKPGCTASAPAAWQAAMIFSATRYDWAAGDGPMATASSAISTARLPASASEYTTAVAIPRRRQVRMIRTATSPRLAIRILENKPLPFARIGAYVGFELSSARPDNP